MKLIRILRPKYLDVTQIVILNFLSVSFTTDQHKVIWFRIFGRGLLFTDTTTEEHVIFSVRTGAVKTWRVGKWRIKILKPNK